MATLGLLWSSSPRFRNLFIFHGLVPHSWSSLPPLPFRTTLLFDYFAKTIFPVELLQFLQIPYYFVVCFLVGRWPYFDSTLPGPVVLLWKFAVCFPRSCLVFLICRSRLSGARECLGICGLSNLTNRGRFRSTSLRVHLGYLLASGPALALVLHLPLKCGSRTPGLEFRCRIVSRGEGFRVSWVPLGVERVACMTAAYLETSSRNLYNEAVLVIALTLS